MSSIAKHIIQGVVAHANSFTGDGLVYKSGIGATLGTVALPMPVMHTSGVEDRLKKLEELAERICAMQRMLCTRLSLMEGEDAMSERPADNPVQRNVDAVIDDMVKGKTTKPQEDALGKALQDRKVGRAFGR